MLIDVFRRTNLLKEAEGLSYHKADTRACKYTDEDAQWSLRHVYIKIIDTIICYSILD